MNYSELSQQIQDELENTETTFVSHIPDFVKQAERRIANDSRLPIFRGNEETAVGTSTFYIQKPTDLVALTGISYIASNVHTNLIEKDISYLREAYPNDTTTGTPRYYAEFSGTDWVLAPGTSASGTIRVSGFYVPTSIVTASTTWVGDNAPNALLYASLVEAYIYMKGDADILGMYEQRYRDEMDMLKGIDRNLVKRDEFTYGQQQVR